MPPHPSLATVIAAVVRFKWALTRTDLRTLTHQPRMSDVRAIAVDRILSRLLVPAFLSRATLVPVLVATQFDLLRRHGNSPSCPQCLMNAGTMSLMMSSPGLARRLGATGLQLLEQTAFDHHGKALATYGIILQQLSEDDRMAWQHFMIASHAARAAGDLEFASYGHQHAIDAGLSAGEPLATVRGWARDALAVEGTEHVTEQHDLATEQDRLIDCLQTGQGTPELLRGPRDDTRSPNVKAMREYTRYWVARLNRQDVSGMPLDRSVLAFLRQALGRRHAALS